MLSTFSLVSQVRRISVPSAYTLRNAFQPFGEISTLSALKVASEIIFFYSKMKRIISLVSKKNMLVVKRSDCFLKKVQNKIFLKCQNAGNKLMYL